MFDKTALEEGINVEAPPLKEGDLENAKKLIGIDYRSARARLALTEDAIRVYSTNYMGSRNPIFFDSDYASRTVWGVIIAPPTIVGTAVIAPGLPGVQWIYSGTRWRFYKIMRAGDVIVQRGRLIGAEEKIMSHGERMILQIGETTCTNQNGDLVARATNYGLRIPRTESGGGMKYKPRGQEWTDEQLKRIEEEVNAEEIRGENPRYWEDIEIGEIMHSIVYGPLRTIDIGLARGPMVMGILYGLKTEGSFAYQWLKRKRHPGDVYTDQKTGVPDHPHRGHWEEKMARAVGMPGRYDVGYHRLSWICRLAMDWMGDDGFIKELEGFVRKPNVVSDITRISGKVVGKDILEKDHVVSCELWAENQLGEKTMTGKALIRLPSRSLEDKA